MNTNKSNRSRQKPSDTSPTPNNVKERKEPEDDQQATWPPSSRASSLPSAGRSGGQSLPPANAPEPRGSTGYSRPQAARSHGRWRPRTGRSPAPAYQASAPDPRRPPPSPHARGSDAPTEKPAPPRVYRAPSSPHSVTADGDHPSQRGPEPPRPTRAPPAPRPARPPPASARPPAPVGRRRCRLRPRGPACSPSTARPRPGPAATPARGPHLRGRIAGSARALPGPRAAAARRLGLRLGLRLRPLSAARSPASSPGQPGLSAPSAPGAAPAAGAGCGLRRCSPTTRHPIGPARAAPPSNAPCDWLTSRSGGGGARAAKGRVRAEAPPAAAADQRGPLWVRSRWPPARSGGSGTTGRLGGSVETAGRGRTGLVAEADGPAVPAASALSELLVVAGQTRGGPLQARCPG